MRKILIALVATALIALVVVGMINGIPALKIKGYKELVKKDKELDTKIADIKTLQNVTFNGEKERLNSAVKLFNEKRDEYLAKLEESKKGKALEYEIFRLDFLWTRIGNYASNCGLDLRIEVENGSNIETKQDYKYYNLKIRVEGNYGDIVRFIYKIEGDNEVAAEISGFSMEPVKTNTDNGLGYENQRMDPDLKVVGEFYLRNVPLKKQSLTALEVTEKKPVKDVKDPSAKKGN